MTERLLPIHPGEYLRELLDELGMSGRRFAQHIGVSPMRISLILRGERPVGIEMALLFAKAFGTSAHYWLNLQNSYDLACAKVNHPAQLDSIQSLYA
jgi:addiction module HigA family antidote